MCFGGCGGTAGGSGGADDGSPRQPDPDEEAEARGKMGMHSFDVGDDGFVTVHIDEAVLDLGATRHEHQPGTSFRVFLDPAGHPFCLCVD